MKGDFILNQNNKKLRIVNENVVSKRDPSKIIGNDPTKFDDLVVACQAAVKTMETGEWYLPQSLVAQR